MQIFNMQTIAQTIMSLEQDKPKKKEKKLKINIVFIGHKDSGKSTTAGQLIYKGVESAGAGLRSMKWKLN